MNEEVPAVDDDAVEISINEIMYIGALMPKGKGSQKQIDEFTCGVCLNQLDHPFHKDEGLDQYHDFERIPVTEPPRRDNTGKYLFFAGVGAFFLLLWLLRSNGII